MTSVRVCKASKPIYTERHIALDSLPQTASRVPPTPESRKCPPGFLGTYRDEIPAVEIRYGPLYRSLHTHSNVGG